MKTLLTTTASAAALLWACAATAETAPTPDVAGEEGSTAVTEVIVTATRSPQPLDRIGASVTVLGDAAIRADQAVTIVDLIARTPGISVSRNGGPGSVTSVYVRGAESYHSVVVIDGVRLTDPATTRGGASFGNLLVGDTSRVEILRGAQSTLWGSQAIGGVINIVTAQPKSDFEGTGSIEVGTDSTAYARVGVGGAGERLTWRGAASAYTTDGFSAAKAGSEKDGYENIGFSGRVTYAFTDALSVDVRSAYSNAAIDFDGFSMAPPYDYTDNAEYGRTKELVSYAGLNLDLLEGRLKNRLSYSFAQTRVKNLDPTPGAFAPITFESDGEVRRLEYQGSLLISDGWTASFGAETEHARLRYESQFSFAPLYARAESDSLYVQLQGEVLPGLTLTGGARYDDHDIYGGKTVGQIAAAWRVTDKAIVRASASQGFRAPGLYELYSEYGNTALQPEEVDSFDLGVTYAFIEKRLTASATLFRREVDNQITFFDCFSGTSPLCTVGGVPRFGFYENTLRATADGIEIEGEFKATEALTLSANYTYTDAVNASGPNAGNRLARRPENLGNIAVSYGWQNGVSASLAARIVGESFTSDFNTSVIAGYTLVDLRAAWSMNEMIEVFGRVENLFDEDYETVPTYGTAGRGAVIGVRGRF